MTRAVARDPIYRRRRFSAETIELCVRWYITYRLSYRDLVAMVAERGIAVSHTTILRWVLRYVPEFEKRWARYARPVNASWRMDETAVSVRGGKHYLYRAVDRQGKSVEHLLCADRSRDAAQAFFRKAVVNATEWPRTVNLDGNLASHLALRMLGEEDPRWQGVVVRNRRYLNNVVEQDHRAIKSRCAPMLGFKSFGSAAITLAGIELAHRIRKGQFSFANEGDRGVASLKQLWDQAIADADATNREPEKEPSSATPANAPELTASGKKRRLRRFPGGIRHIRPVRQARKFSEGGGLYLLVAPTGGRYWRYNYRFSGKQKTLALGVYPDVPREKARARHEKARRLLAAGIDPSLHRCALRQGSTVEQWATVLRTSAELQE